MKRWLKYVPIIYLSLNGASYGSDEWIASTEQYEVFVDSYELKRSVPFEFALDDDNDKTKNKFSDFRLKSDSLIIKLIVEFPIGDLEYVDDCLPENVVQLFDVQGNVVSNMKTPIEFGVNEDGYTLFILDLQAKGCIPKGPLLIKGSKCVRVIKYKSEPKIYLLKDILDKPVEVNGKMITFSLQEDQDKTKLLMEFVKDPFTIPFEVTDKNGKLLTGSSITASPTKNGYIESRDLLTDSLDDVQLRFKIVEIDKNITISIDTQVDVQLESQKNVDKK